MAAVLFKGKKGMSTETNASFSDTSTGGDSAVSKCRDSELATIEDVEDAQQKRLACLLESCLGEIVGSVQAVAPDPATREFHLHDFAALVEGYPQLLEADVLQELITLVLDTQREDGALAAKITFNGMPLYSPSDTSEEGAISEMTPPQSMVNLVWHSRISKANSSLVHDSLEALSKALRSLPHDPESDLIVLSETAKAVAVSPSPGIANPVASGGRLLPSLLYVRACEQVGDLYQATGDDGEADVWRSRGRAMAKRIRMSLWDKKRGLFKAGTQITDKHDIWGSALAVYINVATSGQLMSIAGYLRNNCDELFYRGHLRRFATDEDLSVATEPQHNDRDWKFWAFPVGWAAYALNIIDPILADSLISEYFQTQKQIGVFQWINRQNQSGGVGNLASAALPLGGIRRIIDKRLHSTL